MTHKNDADHWETVARWAVAIAMYLGGCILLPDNASDAACCTVLLVAVAAFWLLKIKARRERERRIDAAGLRSSIGQ